jgi:AcrR family transcriptional regulator
LSARGKAPESPRRGRPRSRAADEAIHAAALALFVEHGVDGVSIEQTAQRAGVTRATVYRRWRSKDALLAEAIGSMRERAERSLGEWEHAPLDEILDWLVDTVPRVLARAAARKLLARLIGSAPTSPQLMATYWDGYLQPRRQAFGRILERARKHGSLRAAHDTEVLQDMIAGALLCHVLIRPGERTARGIRAYLLRVLRELELR